MKASSLVGKFNTLKHKAVQACEHHPMARRMLSPVRSAWIKLGIGRYLVNYVPSRQNRYEEFTQYYDLHKQDFSKLFEMLEDDFSRHTLERVLAVWISRDTSQLKDVYVQPQYFQKDIFTPVNDEVFVDGGAYVGDTIDSFLKDFVGGYITKRYMLGNLTKTT